MSEEKKKLSYEDLENAARQISVQLDAAVKENRQLKAAVQQLQMNDVYTELGLRFKVIENSEAFSNEFVETCVHVIEDIMTPKRQDENPENEE